MSINKQAIGIFDSGVGGTSIFKEINALLPHEDTLYLADSKNAPYGNKSKDEIIALSIKNTELLLNKDCKLIVVACNTATTNAIKILRETYNVPFIGIEPAIKPAAHFKTQSKAIGILATKGTLSSDLFHNTTDLYTNDITVCEQIGEGIVELIEAGKINSDDMSMLLDTYLKPMLELDIDYLVLGCTHYSYLIPLLLEMLPKHVKIIDSGLAVAKQTKAVLRQHEYLNTSSQDTKNIFYSNGNITVLEAILEDNFIVKPLDF